MRADLALVEAGLSPSRAQAQALIEQGVVFVRRGVAAPVAVRKASQHVEPFETLELAENQGPRYVSRGGLKLHHALEHLGWHVTGLACIDLGQSTGGFTDCLLQRGARSVIGVDVGKDQLHPSLRNHTQVFALEGVNLKTANPVELLEFFNTQCPAFLPIGLAVADLSFISLGKVIPTFANLLPSNCMCLWLVKPQFEVGPEHIGKQGLVKLEAGLIERVHTDIHTHCTQHGFDVQAFFPCAIKGGEGNQEYFVAARKRTTLLSETKPT